MSVTALTQRLALLFIIILAFSLRLYRINNPPLDWHAFRQADTASVTREYVKNGVDLLYPKYHDLSNIQSGQPNPEGYRMVEFPFVNAGLAIILRQIPQLDLIFISRLSSILASLITLVALFHIGRLISGRQVGLLTALVFAILPYAQFYSHAILPEPYLLATLTLAIATFLPWVQKNKWRWYLISLFCFAIALLLKPFALFFAPVLLAIFIAYKAYRQKRNFVLLGLYGFSIVPLVIWRQWITQFPAGIPANDWLFNSNGIRLRPAWFRWLFYERMTKLLLGFVGIIFLPFSLIKLHRTEVLIYGAWWLSVVIYFIVIATGNVQHDYYQNLVIPIMCLTLGRGAIVLQRLISQRLHPLFSWSLISLLLLGMWWGGWQQVKGYFNVNHWEYVKAGAAVNRLTPPDALVIAPALGDTQFLFQTNRRGWPLGFDIGAKIQQGAEYYITTTLDDEANELQAKYVTIEQTNDYLLLDLTKQIDSTK